MRIIKGWVARNKGEYEDLQNMSFFNTKNEAKKCFGDRQEYIPVKIIFPDDLKSLEAQNEME